MVVLFQQYIKNICFFSNFPLVGSVIGGFYWLFSQNFKKIKHQSFSMTQPKIKLLFPMTKAFQKCKQSAQSLFHPIVGAGKTTNRDSINTKVFEEKGVGFGEG
ncbi:MAG: hypothetical protein KH745_08625, partial [Bilophila sp.]|nr:hypothetical protein [Bilophila sp.]